MIGAVGSVFLLDHALIPEDTGWWIAFFIGQLLGLVIIQLRQHIPESLRWIVTHGREEEAEGIVDGIEACVRAQGKFLIPVDPGRSMRTIPEEAVSYSQLVDVFFR